MQKTFENKTHQTNQNSITSFSLIESRVEALKALATLLLKEVESLKDMPPVLKGINVENDINLQEELEKIEIELIRHALIRARGHQSLAARHLGVKKTTLNAKIKRYEINYIFPAEIY